MDNSNGQNNRPNVDFEELLKKIEAEQKTQKPQEPVEEKEESSPVKEEEELVVPKRRQDFVINIKDDDFAEQTDEEFVRVDRFTGPKVAPVKPDMVTDEFATRNIDLEKELQQQGTQKSGTLSSFIYVACVLLVSVFLSVFIINTARDVFGIAKTDQEYAINVGSQTTVSKIAKSLAKAGIIEHSSTFKLYAGIRYDDETVQEGNYILNSKMSYDELILTLITTDDEAETVTVSIPEGLNIVEVANLLQENKVCKAADFIAAAKETYGFEFEDEIPENELVFCRLEGYIFPNTHEFYVGEDPKSVVKRFLRDFQQKVMTSQLTERMKEMGMTLHETMVLASMIQEEASYLEDMYKVSSVFHNRLRDTYDFTKLQSDVTYFYAYDTIANNLEKKNQAVLDAYNTYECEGLPVGCITNPGLEAIKAALYPDETSYYYFVTDVNGDFYYASTLRGHQNNIAKAEKVGDTVHGTTTKD